MSSDPGNLPLQLQFVFIALMILLNGFVVLSNTAMNALSRNKIRQLAGEDKKAEKLLTLLEKPTEYRFTNRLLSYIFIAAGLFFAIMLPYSDILSVIAFVALTVVFSEFFTRKVAQQHSESIALSLTGIQKFFVVVLKPFVTVLSLIANLFLKLFHQDTEIEYSGYSEERVMSMLEAGQQSGEIKEEGKKDDQQHLSVR